MNIHHIAIGTKNLPTLFEFYKMIPGVLKIKKNFTEDGHFRSFWIYCKSGLIIMIEEKDIPKAPEALIFSIFNEEGEFLDLNFILPLVIEKTDYTYYFLDPDGNKLGYSAFPKKINFLVG